MRTIIFRAWDNQSKTMRTDFLGKSGDSTGDWIFFASNTKKWVQTDKPTPTPQPPTIYAYPRSQFNLMQSSGLKDRIGNMVYEQDIIQMGGCLRGIVIYKNGSFDIDRTIESVPYNQQNYTAYVPWTNEFMENCLVIGNTFENPNLLLEGKK